MELKIKNMDYKLSKTISKGIVSVIIFAIPLFVLAYPQWAELSIGGALVMLVNYLKNR